MEQNSKTAAGDEYDIDKEALVIDGANFSCPDVIAINTGAIFSIGRPRNTKPGDNNKLIVEIGIGYSDGDVIVRHEGFDEATGNYADDPNGDGDYSDNRYNVSTDPLYGRYSNLSGTIYVRNKTGENYTLTQMSGSEFPGNGKDTGGEPMILSEAGNISAMRPGSDIDEYGNLAGEPGNRINDGYTYGYETLGDVIGHHNLYGTPEDTLYIVGDTTVSDNTVIPENTSVLGADRVVSGQYGTDITIESKGNPSEPRDITIGNCHITLHPASDGSVLLDYDTAIEGIVSKLLADNDYSGEAIKTITDSANTAKQAIADLTPGESTYGELAAVLTLFYNTVTSVSPMASVQSFTGDDHSITIDPTDENIWYALVDGDGKIVKNPSYPNGWQNDGNGDAITFDDLDNGAEYKIITRPKTDNNPPTVSEPISGGTGVITAPEAVDVTRAANGTNDKLTFESEDDKEYAVVKKGETPGDSDWFAGGNSGNGTVTDGGGGYLNYGNNSGTTTVTGLDLNEEYEVIVRVKNTDPDTTVFESVTEVPERGGTALPGLAGGEIISGDDTSITIDPTDSDTWYALVDENGEIVKNPNYPNGWQNDGTGGAITFDGLEDGTEYYIVTQPKSDSNTPTATEPIRGGTVVITAPEAADVTRAADGATDKITFATEGDKEYAVVKKGETPNYTDWFTGGDSGSGVITDGDGTYLSYINNNGLATVTGIDTNTEYEVIVRVKNSDPGTTVLENETDVVVLPGTALPGLEGTVTNEVISGDDTSIIIDPTDPDTWYALVDENGEIVKGGNHPDGWLNDGNGGAITFDDPDEGTEYFIVTQPKTDSNTPSVTEPIRGGTAVITAPEAVDVDRAADGTTGNDKFTFATEDDKEYAVVKKGESPADSDWFTGGNSGTGVITDGDGTDLGYTNNNGTTTVTGIDPDEEYEVIVRIKNSNPGTTVLESVTEVPEVSGSGTTLHGLEGTTTVDEKVTGDDNCITINPTDRDTWYAVVDDEGSIVGDWQNNAAGSALTFGGLEDGEEYTIVTYPKTDSSKPNACEPISGGTSVITAPDAVTGVVRDDAGDGSDTITFPTKDTTPELEYAVYEKGTDTLAPNGTWTVGNGNDRTVTGLDPTKEYEVRVRVVNNDSDITVLESITDVSVIPETTLPGLVGGETVTGDDNSITINPTDPDTWYALVDKETGEIVGGNPDGWQNDEIGGEIIFGGLEDGKEYIIVTQPKPDGSKPDVNEPIDGGTTVITAPEAVAANRESAGNGKDTITFPTKDETPKLEYAVYEKGTDTLAPNGAWTVGNGNDRTVTGLDPNKEYEVCVRVKNNEPGTIVFESVTDVETLPETVLFGLESTAIDEKITGNDNSIIINPTDSNTWYALVDENGNIVTGGSYPDGWQNNGTGGAITFDGLDDGTEYFIVTYPKTDNNKPTVNEPIHGGTSVITAPEAIDPDDITRTHSGNADTITFPTESGNEYAVYEKGRNSPVTGGDWTSGSGNDRTVGGLDPDKEYEVRVRVNNTDPGTTALESKTDVPVLDEETYTIDGMVLVDETGAPIENATVTLVRGNEIAGAGVQTDANGEFSFTDVPNGTYNIVVVRDDGTVMTQLIVMDNANVNNVEIRMPIGNKSSVVDVVGDTPNVIVGELDNSFTDEDDEIVGNNGTVELRFIAEQKDESGANAVNSGDKGKIDDVKGNMTIGMFLDFQVKKTVTEGGVSKEPENITKMPKLLEILIPLHAELQGMASYRIYRVHDGGVHELPQRLTAPAAGSMDECIVLNKVDGKTVSITVYANKFSTYALAYSAAVLSSDCNVTGVTSPSNAAINGTTITKTVSSSTTSQTINVSINGVGWKLYSDADCTQEITNKTISSLSTGANTAYIKVIAADGSSKVYTVTITRQDGGGSHSGGGGGGGTTSNITITTDSNGSVTTNPKNPGSGNTVTITVKPDAGYELDTLTIKDSAGRDISFTDNGDGTYTYVQPNGKVTVNATFKRIDSGNPDDNGVSDMLNTTEHMAYLSGYPDGTFGPDANMTRAEVAMMLYRLLNNKNIAKKAAFSDVTDGEWYSEAVHVLSSIGIINGYPDGTFAPEATITRAEFVAMVTRFANAAAGRGSFIDVTSTHWAFEAINTAVGYGWINGYPDGTFKPANNITRAEATKVMNAVLGRTADKAYIDSAAGLKAFSDVTKDLWAYYEIMEATNAHDYEKTESGENWK